MESKAQDGGATRAADEDAGVEAFAAGTARGSQDNELEESEKFYVGQPRFLLLLYALYNTLVARSEMVCYFVIILGHMVSTSMISLMLPILFVLWAMLSIPRPSRRFWMMTIIYMELGFPPVDLPDPCFT
ncbi:unnamed protein product [Rangifer tarandus platyrhynchus]|uniref:Piezo transmembrane helical unit domain-containing protein n=1 Tax=Rangifer tarandus platyrhynchus TaxID=3082113 RepID=A0ABN9A969_RANTA|nr:unnamed protein product [Rangifer tarandus platyrhynchus]